MPATPTKKELIRIQDETDGCLFSARLATVPYELDSNITQLLANLLTKPSVFYYLPIVTCNLVSKKLFVIIIILMSLEITFNSDYLFFVLNYMVYRE